MRRRSWLARIVSFARDAPHRAAERVGRRTRRATRAGRSGRPPARAAERSRRRRGHVAVAVA
ncbi:hypothetical protein WI23_29610 [Burkholderia oklahomensis C6786]|nr:hypothetical protein WI23_29610 [Burkholderia oklahomensis C6786]KUY47261.1 hypothetical protein WI23_30145 [Burkholderia oklahomensis C6786]